MYHVLGTTWAPNYTDVKIGEFDLRKDEVYTISAFLAEGASPFDDGHPVIYVQLPLQDIKGQGLVLLFLSLVTGILGSVLGIIHLVKSRTR